MSSLLRWPRFFSGLALALIVCIFAGCGGGGGSGCALDGGSFAFVYSPELKTTAPQPTHGQLSYKLGEAKTWKLQVTGITAGCMANAKFRVFDGQSLPAGVTLNPTTGDLSTTGLTRHVEGECLPPGAISSSQLSVNRVCPDGMTVGPNYIFLSFSSDAISPPASFTVSFTPEG
ncbi:hypothetical protein [Roseateles sp. NT4]|uniref:hypothetical protein n=1 Tax=Roseateles sp. NT4 TaxID=3453715 RepID=UPI003F71C762